MLGRHQDHHRMDEHGFGQVNWQSIYNLIWLIQLV